MTGYKLLGAHRPGAIFARRSGRPIYVETFLHDVAALAKLLPRRGHVVNLCRDRYRFAVGFAAALCRAQLNLLPPHDSPGLLEQLRADYPDLYCLTDGASAPADLPSFDYPPARATIGGPAPVVPVFPAAQPAAVLFTSGSTGRPTPHVRSWGELVTSAIAEGQRLGVAALGQVSLLGTVPHQHSYGLESLLMLALQHGLVLHAERLFYPADIRAELAAAPRPTMLVTTPVHLRILLAEPETPPPVDLVLCATAPLPEPLAREAEARFAVSLYEIYGCSEAGQIAARRTAVTEEWRCLDGIVLRQDDTGTWASGTPIAVETLLPDVIELHDPERFVLRGRIADLVNIAGKRTSLSHLNFHLNAIDGVSDGVFVMSNEETDAEATTRLAAFAVTSGRTAAFIMDELRKRIDAAFLPRPLCLVPVLPRNALGKLPREEIQRLIAQARGDRLVGGMAQREIAIDHPAAAGHFPGNPIIPGAVLLREIVAAVFEAKTPSVYEIRAAKFLSPVRPGDRLVIRWTAETEGQVRFSCSVAGSDRPSVTGAIQLP